MDELRALLKLSLPLLATQLGAMLLGLVDTAIVGRLGEVPLGAVGLGNNLYFLISVLGLGCMLALDPLISQALGAGEHGRAGALLWQGRYVALLVCVPLGLLVAGLALALPWLGIDEATTAEARPYLYARLLGLAPFLLFAATRAFLQAQQITRPLLVAVVVANLVNAPLSWALVFGVPAIGLPSLGAGGAGLGSAIVTVVQLAMVGAAVARLPGTGRAPVDVPVMRRVLALGAPIGLQLFAEVGSFGIVALLMGNLGARALASHNVALTLVSTTFQFAIAIGAASSVRVGRAIGAGDVPGTRRAGLTAIGAGATCMLGSAAAFLLAPRPLARLLTDDADVIAAAVPLFAVAAAFQLSDGVQAVAAGALRGAGDTRWPLVSNLVGHYAIGVPIGAWLTFEAGWGATGLWWGLSAGLTAVAVALAARFVVLSARPIARVE